MSIIVSIAICWCLCTLLLTREFGCLQEGGIAVNVQSYTSLMDAFLKDGGSHAADMVFQLFDEMRAAGIAPSAVTYGCLLLACRLQARVDLAFLLYQQACDEVCASSPVNLRLETKKLP